MIVILYGAALCALFFYLVSSPFGGSIIMMKIGNKKTQQKINHPIGLLFLLLAITAPIIPNITLATVSIKMRLSISLPDMV
jgi:hypothetical protein